MRRLQRTGMLILSTLLAMACSPIRDGTALAAEAGSPYGPSSAITGIAFEWHTHKRRAPGSDNMPITWSGNDHQYTAWGDGGGFEGGTDSTGRVSLGVARVEGTSAVYQGYNVWGGRNPEVPAKFEGKSYGILAIGTDLYMWRCGTGKADLLGAQRLYKSTDNGRNWAAASWEFPPDTTFYCPTFLQFGKGYAGARDAYVYMYAAEQTSAQWGIHKPGKILLMRAPQNALMNRGSFEFFTGRDASGNALWSPDISARRPVIEDRNGLRLVSAAYNPGLNLYLIGYAHTERRGSDMAILDAPTPWGPWTTVMYDYNWGVGKFTGSCCLLIHFAPKWWMDGGKRFTVVFSGGSEADSWNTVEGTFTVGGTAPAAGTSKPAPQPLASPAANRQDRGSTATPDAEQPQNTLARRRARSQDKDETSAPADAAPPARGTRRQISARGSASTSRQLPPATDAKPAWQRGGTVLAGGEAASAPAAEGQPSPAGTLPSPPPAPVENMDEAAATSEDTFTGAPGPEVAPVGEPREHGRNRGRTSAGSAASTSLDHATATAAAGPAPVNAASGLRPAGDAGGDLGTTSPPSSLSERAQPSPGPQAHEPVPRRRTAPSGSRQPAPSAAAVPRGMPEAASASPDLWPEPRLVGTMRRDADWLAIVIPAGASDPVTVRPGDTLGRWSVSGVERHTLALRAGDRALDLHLFGEAEEGSTTTMAR